MKPNLRQDAGSLLVVGLGGTGLSDLERAWLRLVRPGGVILFRRNIADAAQTRALLAEATALCAPDAFRCIDAEGGTVDRLREALAAMPAAQSVARAARTAGRPALAREHGELVARAIKAFGFNTTLAPVLDLGLPESAAVLGTRTAGETAAEVTAYAREFLAGLAAQDVIGCGKHFPGLGAGALDSHHETPHIARRWDELWRQDLAPYRALRDQLPMVMMNHAAYPRTRGRDRPASTSRYWITTVLRQRIGYRGLVFSDDLEMGGILRFMPVGEAAAAALGAGANLLEICHSPELILRAYEGLLSEAERSAAFARLLSARARLLARVRARLFAGGVPRPLSTARLEALRARILGFRATVTRLEETGNA
ncbi:MAG: beta-N-acetylhexosaminidase [Terracidiphilus sp.]